MFAVLLAGCGEPAEAATATRTPDAAPLALDEVGAPEGDRCAPPLTSAPEPPEEAVPKLDDAPGWESVGSLHQPRRNAYAQALPDGRAIVAGGTY
jgi:hypothetical protein